MPLKCIILIFVDLIVLVNYFMIFFFQFNYYYDFVSQTSQSHKNRGLRQKADLIIDMGQ